MNKRPELTARTRERLTDAFWQLYRKKNVNEIRIIQITDLAGYHRATFYEYFNDINDLLNQEVNSLVRQLELVQAATDQKSRLMFSEILSFYQNNASKISLLIGRGNMVFLNHLKQTLYPFFLKENSLKDCGQNAIIFEYGISGLLMSCDYWYRHQDTIPLEEYLKTLRMIISPVFDSQEE